ncbi:S8 family serine peptidase [Alistipes sp.]|uniref:S8 family serine peptidase n=1 Tax=Alistipes sp. TaxID=1872444 RepID=UPI0025C19F37|nr:S8 family serine peptidase [Alistipes sp.]
MKKLLLLCGLLALFGCTDEPMDSAGSSGDPKARVLGSPTSRLALRGSLCVKLSPEMAQTVAAAQAQLPVARGGVATRSGVGDIDAVLREIDAGRFERVVAYNPEWEALYDETGINRWYAIAFDDEAKLSEVGARLAALPGIAVVEYGIDPRYIRPMSEGPAIPASERMFASVGEKTRAAKAMNDPMLPYQWNYDNPGGSHYPDVVVKPKAGADIDLLDAWQLCTGGEEIVVAVIDEPVQTTHPDLRANIWSHPKNSQEHGYNFWDDTPELNWKSVGGDARNPQYADHGTHVAGVIAAVNNNGRGVCGIAGGRSNRGGVRIMSCQIMGHSTTGGKGNPAVKALEYAWTNGAIIAQNSWGYSLDAEDGTKITPEEFEQEWNSNYGIMRDAIDTFVRGAGSRNPNSPLQGGLVVFAAGNEGDIYGDARIYPAAYDPVIAVGAMDWSFRPAYYTDYGAWVDITAPGGDLYSGKAVRASSGGDAVFYSDAQILSTILCDDAIAYQDGRKSSGMYGYGFMQGTSMACPHVSGVAALGLAYAAQNGKKYTPAEFKALLLSSVYGIDGHFSGAKAGTLGPIADLGVYKNKMGGGCIDALKLLFAIKGTPAIYVRTGEPVTVDFARYFGGEQGRVALTAASLASPGNLGLSSSKAVVDGTKITFDCPEPGTSMLRFDAVAGDTKFVREFAIVSRAGLAANGGWL